MREKALPWPANLVDPNLKYKAQHGSALALLNCPGAALLLQRALGILDSVCRVPRSIRDLNNSKSFGLPYLLHTGEH